RNALKKELGIDNAVPAQYLISLKNMAQGNMGNSMQTRKPVTAEIKRRIPITGELALLASLIALSIAIPAGVISATRQKTAIDQGVRVASILALSVPGFWTGTMVVLLPALLCGYGPPPIYQSPIADLAP